MIYREEFRDLFSVSNEYYLAHCISADFGMGKGIAVLFNKHYDMKNTLQLKYRDYVNIWHANGYKGDCILEWRVFNLVTKERYWYKPTYESMQAALDRMYSICINTGIRKIAMPVIGCGLDRLEWEKVSEQIKETFGHLDDMEILVCKQ